LNADLRGTRVGVLARLHGRARICRFAWVPWPDPRPHVTKRRPRTS